MAEYVEMQATIALIEEKQRQLCPMGLFSRNATYGSDREAFDNWQEIIDALETSPAADVAPVRRGRWIIRNDGPYGRRRAYCSVCEQHSGIGGIEKNQMKPYCPNCGARMMGDDGHENA